MNVLFITTWDTACGIATYSANLISAIEDKDVNVEVFSEVQSVSALIRLARNNDCDVIHIQHEFGISVADDVFLSIVSKFRSSGVPVVVTCHSEIDYFNILLDGVADAVILHSDSKNISSKNTFSPFYKIPHGLPEVKFSEDKTFYRKKYDIPEDSFVVGTCGFLTDVRAQDIENVMVAFSELPKSELSNIYFNIATSSHRRDVDGSYANSVRSGIYSLANSKGFFDNVFVGTKFMPTQEFRERLYCCDVGFHIAPIQAGSNSGAAADIVSCGIPLFVNNSYHFSHLGKYSSVISDNPPFKAMVREIIKVKNSDSEYESLLGRCEAAISDLGYSKVAERHIKLYEDVISNFASRRDSVVSSSDRQLNSELPITIRLPNSVWQVLFLYGRLCNLKGYRKHFILQDTGSFDASFLSFVLDIEVDFGDVGMSDSKNSFHLQSKNIAQDMSGDVRDWVAKGKSLHDFFSFCGEFKSYEFNLGNYAKEKADKIACDLVIGEGSEAYLSDNSIWEGVSDLVILASPGTCPKKIEMLEDKVPINVKTEVLVEDTRTRWAILSKCPKAHIGFGADAVFSLLSKLHNVQICSSDRIEKDIICFLKETVNG